MESSWLMNCNTSDASGSSFTLMIFLNSALFSSFKDSVLINSRSVLISLSRAARDRHSQMACAVLESTSA